MIVDSLQFLTDSSWADLYLNSIGGIECLAQYMFLNLSRTHFRISLYRLRLT